MANYRFFENKDCEYYPCHNIDKINCLFCFCPLYKTDCKGNYKILDNGVKDCSDCILPHIDYDYVVDNLK